MRFILIANYPGDRQESMQRYATALKDNLIQHGVEAELFYPRALFVPRSKVTNKGFFKWLGYIDKYLVFPLLLRVKVFKEHKSKRREIYFHICDHSNSIYLKFLPKNNCGITCHDVLAIQGALSNEQTYCHATKTGKLLQRWILVNLIKAKILTTVSQNTLESLLKLTGNQSTLTNSWKVIYNSFNAKFWPMAYQESRGYLEAVGFSKGNFILHVGSGLPRKNRSMIIEMVKILGESWTGSICFAGDPLGKDFSNLIDQAGMSHRVKSIVKPDHLTLVALYSSCEAFIFPSFSEGFGWPLIEAQACGAPVLASSIPTLKEIGGKGALYADPNKPEDFAQAFRTIFRDGEKAKLKALAHENCKRFESQKLTKDFISLYKGR